MTSDRHRRAQEALRVLKDLIVFEVQESPSGLTNADIVKRLGLESNYEGKNLNYLSWSLLGNLLEEGRLVYEGSGQKKRYLPARKEP